MTDLKLWMRVGDQDDYHAFDSIDEAADDLHEMMHCDGPSRACPDPAYQCRGHKVARYAGPALHGLVLSGTGLEGDNGVSFYWGDDDAQFEAEVNYHELEVVQRTLSG